MVGTTVSHYRILSKLGEGGMGVVYKARDLKLDRTLALKFLPPELTRDPDAKQRFMHEAKAASALDHPNVCTVHDIAETDDGQLFIVMACYEGETLREKGERGPLPVEEAVSIAMQIARGLARAHERGIVHRDIKPANIFVSSDGTVRILDFGLAKLSGRTSVTRTGGTVGTTAYMSPEQLRGDPVDHRADIWSLGVTLYESLTGRLPFASDYEGAIVYCVLNEAPTPVSLLRPEIPARVSQCLATALEKEPAHRFQSVEELLQALQSPRDVGVSSSGKKSIAVLPFVNMSANPEQEYFCDGLADEIITSLSQLGGLHVVARTSSFAFKQQAIDVREIGRQLNVEYLLEGSVRTRGTSVRITAQLINVHDGFHLWSQRYDCTMADVFEVQDETTRHVVRALQVALDPREKSLLGKRYTDDVESYTLYLKGRRHWSTYTEEGFRKAIECYEQAIARDPSYALAHAGIAVCNAFLGYYLYVSPAEEFVKAEVSARRSLELDQDLAEAHFVLAWVRMTRDWDWAAAEAAFRRVIELSPGHAIAHAFYAGLLSVVGRYQDSLLHAEEALELDPLSPLIGGLAGLRYYYARQYERSIAVIKNTLETSPDFIPGYWMLSLPLAAAGRVEESIAAADTALQRGSEDDPIVVAIQGIARALSPTRKHQARNAIEKLQRLSQRRPISSFFMGMIHVALEEKDEAFQWFERALLAREPLLMWAGSDPILQDRLRSDQRLEHLLRRLRLRG